MAGCIAEASERPTYGNSQAVPETDPAGRQLSERPPCARPDFTCPRNTGRADACEGNLEKITQPATCGDETWSTRSAAYCPNG